MTTLLSDKLAADLLRGGKVFRKKVLIRAVQIDHNFEVWTHEGLMTAEAGDYLVQNISGESKPWPIKKKIFEETYEEARKQ